MNTTTTDLSDFGYRELQMLKDLINAMHEQGLPRDFYANDVVPMMNRNSGYVFLTNSELQVAMLNGGTLESFYSSPYDGWEGFFDDLLADYENMHPEDQEWFRELAEGLGKEIKTEEKEDD